MKILFVCNEYPPDVHGGIGTFVYTLGKGLVARNHDIFVVGYSDSYNPDNKWVIEEGVNVLRLNKKAYKRGGIRIGNYSFQLGLVTERLRLSKTIRKVTKLKKIDIVESYDWSGPLFSKPFSPLVIRMHGANSAYMFYEGKSLSYFLRWIEKQNIKYADNLISVTEHIGKLTIQSLGLPRKEFNVIYNGVDTELFRSVRSRSDQNQVLYVGSIRPRKGLEELFKVIPVVLEYSPDTKFCFVGRLPSSKCGKKFVSDLMRYIPKEKLDNINFKGHVKYSLLPHYYSNATIAVFPSKAEAFGLTCIEAMACETPVIMTARASGPEIIRHGIDGVLVNPTNSKKLAEAILDLLFDSKKRNQIGKLARERVLEVFDLKEIINQNETFYRNLISNE